MNRKIFAYILSFIIISIPFVTFAAGLVPECNVTGKLNADGTAFAQPCNFKYLMDLINYVITFLLFTVATPFVALILCYVGYLYLTDQGSSKNISKAKTILFNVVIGYVIALVAWLVVRTILKSLGYSGTVYLNNY